MPKNGILQVMHNDSADHRQRIDLAISTKNRRDRLASAVRRFVLHGEVPDYMSYERSMIIEVEYHVRSNNHLTVGPDERLYGIWQRMMTSKRYYMTTSSSYRYAGDVYLDRTYTWPVLSWEVWCLCLELRLRWFEENLYDQV